uniref:Uncharacterized protein n=1 Tax=Romanomermis culicivorax TaxID=13658 RepID=A0A915K901_ROMCU
MENINDVHLLSLTAAVDQ